MNSDSEDRTWLDVVALMRADPATLGEDPAEAWRLPLRLYAAMNRLSLKLAATLGLSSSELSALLALWDGGRCTMTELAERIVLSRAAMTTMVDRLQRVGYLERVPDPNDRRRLFVMVTAQVDKHLREAFAPLGESSAQLASTNQWQPFAITAAELRDHAIATATQIELPKGLRRASPEPQKKRGKPKPTHW